MNVEAISGKIGTIALGWTKWLGWQQTTEQEAILSLKRQTVCLGCEHATPSKFLEFISGGAEQIDGLYCNVCTCPCHQKSLTSELCPLGKWDNL